MYRKSIVETNCSGVRSASNFQRGFPSIFAHKSHKAFIIAAVAKWVTPFSGPILKIFIVNH